MKKFIIEIILFSSILLLSFYWIFSRANGYTDPYYIRFTTSKQSSLILGTSRAAQGLQPKIFNEELNRDDFFNYSFTIGHCPFGKVYLESIKRKLNPEMNGGIFIVCVDPWGISSKNEDPNDIKIFRENKRSLKMKFVNLNPNIFYLLSYYDKHYINLLRHIKTPLLLHSDGWLEVTVKMDSASTHNRRQELIKRYKEKYLPRYKFSSVRYGYLSKTIDFLKDFGEVYLVRLPVHLRMDELDNLLVPDFNEKINYLCYLHNVRYLTFENELLDYEYTEANHLWKESGAKVSERIAKWILDDQAQTHNKMLHSDGQKQRAG